jgi:hypothetical protein
MPGVEKYVALVLLLRSEEAKQRKLRGLDWAHEIVAAVQHQNR